MFKSKAALRLTRSAQTSPARRLTTPLRHLRFSADSSKVISPGCLLPQKVYSNRPLRFLGCTKGKCYRLNRLINVEVARLGDFPLRKSSGRALLLEAIYSLTSVLKSLENSPISTKILQGMEDGDGRLRKGISET